MRVRNLILACCLFISLAGCRESSVTDNSDITIQVSHKVTTQVATEGTTASTTDNELGNEVMLSIPALSLETKVLEGTDNYTLAIATGHIEGTGAVGDGNYCIAGHTGVNKDYIFNGLVDIEFGDEIKLTSREGVTFTYYVTQKTVVEPEETWVVTDFADTRVTLITCTDSGTRRLVVVGSLLSEEEYRDYMKEQRSQKLDDLQIYNSQFSNLRVSDYLDGIINDGGV